MNTIQVTVALRHAPREQSVAAEDKALGAGILFHRPFDHEREFKARPLPRDPNDLAPKFFIEQLQLALAMVGKQVQADRGFILLTDEIAEHLEDVTPEQMQERMALAFAGQPSA